MEAVRKENIIQGISEFNSMISDAQERYVNKAIIEDTLEFPTELDLQRYIDSCNYGKTEFIKEHYNAEDINLEGISDDDKRVIEKIEIMKKALPKEMHKCIGCPCLEYDYPQCEKCSFEESCLSGNAPYPNECNENDCFHTFEYMHSHPFAETIELDQQVTSEDQW